MVSHFRLNTFMSKEVSITMCYVGGSLKRSKLRDYPRQEMGFVCYLEPSN